MYVVLPVACFITICPTPNVLKKQTLTRTEEIPLKSPGFSIYVICHEHGVVTPCMNLKPLWFKGESSTSQWFDTVNCNKIFVNKLK